MKINNQIFLMCCLIISYSLQAETTQPQAESTDTNAEIRAIFDDIASPIIAFDPVGNAIAVWYDNGGTRYGIYAARYVYNSGWQAKVMLSTNVDISAPQIEFDSMGNAFVFWCEDNGNGCSDVYVSRYVVGSGWKPKVNLSSTTMRASNPTMAVDSAGNAIFVWREISVGGYTDYAIRFAVNVGWQSKIKIS